MMYNTQGVLKNVNLRTELAGDDRVGAFDLKIEAMLTKELHNKLCGGNSQNISINMLQTMGLTEIKYGSEIENVMLKVGDLEVKGAKLNKVIGKLGNEKKVVFRLQAHIHHRGLVEDLNAITHEPQEISIEMMQGDMLEAEEKPRKKEKAAEKDEPSGLHVIGDNGVNMTPEQIKAAEEEKQRILAMNKKPAMDHEDLSKIDEMFSDLDEVKMGQGDEHEYRILKEKHNAGKRLTNPQIERLMDIHANYCAAA